MQQVTTSVSGGFVTRLALVAVLAVLGAVPALAQAGPEHDRKALVEFFQQRFPGLKLSDYDNGTYAIDPTLRENWEQIKVFPPYLPYIQQGKQLFNTPFKNGKTYAQCLPNRGIGIANHYPRWDRARGEVVTLALVLNWCREANGEKPLAYGKGDLAYILTYLEETSKGKKVHITVPSDDPRALAAYERGKEFYYARRGQLNFSCAGCHVENAGRRLRTNVLSPALGQATHWPTYRTKWGDMGTLQRRFVGCNKQVRAKPFPLQSREYRDLEYFLTYLSNGLPIAGPGARP